MKLLLGLLETYPDGWRSLCRTAATGGRPLQKEGQYRGDGRYRDGVFRQSRVDAGGVLFAEAPKR